MLIGFRALQGAAAALMLPQVLTFIQAEFDPEPRRAAFAIYGMMLALAGASGPLLGGVLVQANLAGWGWRTIFLVNIPIGLTALAMGSRVIPASRPNHDRPLDPAGTVLLTLALLAVFYPLIEGRQLGWPAWCLACIGVAVPLLAAFAVLEARTRQPLIDFSLFRRRGPGIGLGIALVFFGTTSFFFVLTLFLQLGLGYSALRTGLSFIPFSIGIIIGSGGAAPLGKKYGRRAVTAGTFLMTLAVASMTVTAGPGMPGTWHHPWRWPAWRSESSLAPLPPSSSASCPPTKPRQRPASSTRSSNSAASPRSPSSACCSSARSAFTLPWPPMCTQREPACGT